MYHAEEKTGVHVNKVEGGRGHDHTAGYSPVSLSLFLSLSVSVSLSARLGTWDKKVKKVSRMTAVKSKGSLHYRNRTKNKTNILGYINKCWAIMQITPHANDIIIQPVTQKESGPS